MKAYYFLIFLSLAFCIESVAQSNPGWRGPARDGIYPETGLLKSWPAEGPEQLWSTSGTGKGYSSPVIAGDKIYITGMDEE